MHSSAHEKLAHPSTQYIARSQHTQSRAVPAPLDFHSPISRLKSRGYDAHSHALGRATDLKEILQQS